AQEIWVGELGKLSVNRAVDPSIYPNDVVRKAAQVLSEAEIFRFDGSDLMPSEIGSGAFWTGVLDYVSGADLDDVLEMIEMTAEEVYE
ncbi:MAG: carbohydrate ABC transporter substrate-binding protein, partial [Firmicutes bacterium]|nr:carbohydrate ABC transporter substrate-binding protein [Bacillota bacterium]